MKIKLDELKSMIKSVIREKKKDGVIFDPEEGAEQAVSYKESESFDFSKPQGSNNRYKRQGQSNMGPWTSENMLRKFIRDTIKEEMDLRPLSKSHAKSSAPYTAKVETKLVSDDVGWRSASNFSSGWDSAWYMVNNGGGK